MGCPRRREVLRDVELAIDMTWSPPSTLAFFAGGSLGSLPSVAAVHSSCLSSSARGGDAAARPGRTPAKAPPAAGRGSAEALPPAAGQGSAEAPPAAGRSAKAPPPAGQGCAEALLAAGQASTSSGFSQAQRPEVSTKGNELLWELALHGQIHVGASSSSNPAQLRSQPLPASKQILSSRSRGRQPRHTGLTQSSTATGGAPTHKRWSSSLWQLR